jgi:hypothetical protein
MPIDKNDNNTDSTQGPLPITPPNDATSPPSDSGGRLGGLDPNSPKGQLMAAIEKLIEEMKTGKSMDHSSAMSAIMGKMSAISGGMVSADADTMTAMNKYDAASANMQTAIADQHGTADVPLINKYTGKPELYGDVGSPSGDASNKGKPVLGSPEQAIDQDAEFLKNNPNHQYELDGAGDKIQAKNADGSPKVDANNQPVYVVNRSFNFFHGNNDKNIALYHGMSTNVDNVLSGLDPSYKPAPCSVGTDAVINIDPGDPKATPPTLGCVEKMWNKINSPQGGTDGKKGLPDSTQLQTVQSAHASLVQSLSSNSSAIQALAKEDQNTYTTTTATLNKFDQSWVTVMKACSNGIKSAG